ncbi:hypothetical protein HEGA106846_01950 [Helicobacter ganmani]
MRLVVLQILSFTFILLCSRFYRLLCVVEYKDLAFKIAYF